MAKLISTWGKNLQSVPEGYIIPEHRRPDPNIPIAKEVPVIDFSQAFGSEADRANLSNQMIKALEDHMIFQVVNHGVPEKVMEETIKVYNEFFNLAAEEKEEYMGTGIYNKKPVWLYTGAVSYESEKFHNWKDALGHCVYPIEQNIHTWPDKPAQYREVVAKYAGGIRTLSQTILELIAEGLGLEKEYFAGKLTNGLSFVTNYYPPCPDPSLTIGLGVHRDPNLITLLQQDVYGLQIFKDGKWIGIQPLPNAFVVHSGCQLEVITNGRLKSPLHRAVTNSKTDRTSIGIFVNPSYDCVVEPAKAIVKDTKPVFRAFTYAEFMQNFAKNLLLENPYNSFEL